MQHVGQNGGALRLFRRAEADSQALFAGAGGAADAVNMHLRIPGQLEVHHQRERFDVQAAGGDVGRHQNPDAAVREAHQRLIAVALLEVTVQR